MFALVALCAYLIFAQFTIDDVFFDFVFVQFNLLPREFACALGFLHRL